MPSVLVDESVAPLRDALAPLIADAQARFGIPALSLALVRGEQVLWAEGFGFADPDRGIAADANTRYRAGSLAKPFTALSVLALEAAGEIDIDQPLSAYLEGFRIKRRFSPSANPITVRSVLTHHAGLPSDLNKGLWTDTPFTQVLPALREEYAAFPPHLVFAYSNVGYSLLGHLVQSVAGRPFDAHMREQFFEPLGMAATRFAPAPSAAAPLAVGHKQGRPIATLPIRDVPAQGLETTAADLGRFVGALLGGGRLQDRQVLPPDLIETAMDTQNSDVALDLDVVTGFGWFLETDAVPGAQTAVRHGGATLAYTAELMLLPEEGVGIAVLASAGGAREVVSQLARSVLAQTVKLMPEALPPDFLLSDTPKSAGSAETIDSDGRYATDFGLIAIRADESKLCACMTGETLDLVAAPQGWLGVGDVAATGTMAPSTRPLSKMRFQTRRIDGRDVVVADTGDGEVVLGEKIAREPVPEAWLDRLGRYRIVNPDADFPVVDLTLKLNEGQLCMSYRMPLLSTDRIQIPVRAVSEDQGIVLGLGRTRGDTVRFVQRDADAVPMLRYSGYFAERVESDSTASTASAKAP
ncbi:MAG: beta-lactamase family protein [Thiohalocapsa sp.]|nr:beta-lactamase family protein [Thiohalocapsa sp.]